VLGVVPDAHVAADMAGDLKLNDTAVTAPMPAANITRSCRGRPAVRE
jgi:hypothetical protein